MNEKILNLMETIENKKKDMRKVIENKKINEAESLKNELDLLNKELELERMDFEENKNRIVGLTPLGKTSNAVMTARNVKTGESVAIYNKDQKMSDPDKTKVAKDGSDLSLGGFLRGVLLNKWDKYNDKEAKYYASMPGATGGQVTIPRPLSLQLIDLVREEAMAIQAGAWSISMESETLKIARLDKDVEVNWRAYGSKIQDTGLAFSPVELRACSLAGIAVFNRENMSDSIFLEQTIIQSFARSLALALDKAVFYGTGQMVGDERIEPLGLVNRDDVHVTTVSGMTWQDINTGITQVRMGNFEPNTMVMSPIMRNHLENQTDTTGQPLNQPASTFNLDRLSSNQAMASDVFIADWSNVLIGMRDEIEIELGNTTETFERNQIAVRAVMRADVAVRRPQGVMRLIDSAVSEPAMAKVESKTKKVEVN